MDEKRKELMELLELVTNEKILDYLLPFTKDFIERHTLPQATNTH